MIEQTTVNGRPALVGYINDQFEPVTPEASTLVRVNFIDEQGGSIFLVPANEPKKAFDPNEPRDEHGRWTSEGGGEGDHPGHGYSKDAYEDSQGVIHTSSVYDAARALSENRKVELNQVKEISTLIKHLGQVAKNMETLGEKAPLFNLCNVTIKGTNLFCVEAKDIKRVEMPVIPAKRTSDFIDHLKSLGYEVEKGKEKAANLRATQKELDGAKVAQQMKRIKKEGFYKRLVVSRDDYILDGHHTWAGELGLDAKDNNLYDDKEVKIARVNISITKLLEVANEWIKEEGIAKKPAGQKSVEPPSDEKLIAQETAKAWRERAEALLRGGHDVDYIKDPATGQFQGSHPSGDGDKQPEALTAAPDIPGPHPDVINVGGDDWNRQTAERLEKEFLAAKPDLEKIVSDAVGGKVKVETPGEEPDPDNAPIVPDSWELLSNSQQDEAFDDYKSQTLSDFHDSEVTNWYENSALDDAGADVAWHFNKSGDKENQWALDAINEYKEENHVPFDSQQLLNAVTLDYENYGNNDAVSGLDIGFDDSKLTKPEGYDPAQQTLPGIEPPKPSDFLTADMRKGLIADLEAAFVTEAEDKKDKMDPPDYIDDSVAETQEMVWSEMSDKEKFAWVENNTTMVSDAQKEYDDYFGNNQEGGETGEIDKLPNKYDPLQQNASKADYTRTQLIARHLSIERAARLMQERGVKDENNIKLSAARARESAKTMDRDLWSHWKSSSHNGLGQLLQLAAHEELGGRLNPGMVQADYARSNAKSFVGGYDGVKAYMRAKWETSQYLLSKSGDNTVNVFRAVTIPESTPPGISHVGAAEGWNVRTQKYFDDKTQADAYRSTLTAGNIANIHQFESKDKNVVEAVYNFKTEPEAKSFSEKWQKDPSNPAQHRESVETPDTTKPGSTEGRVGGTWTRLPDIHIVRNGAASTSLEAKVSNNWDGSTGRVVLRASVPRTAVISVPAFGQNVYGEHEVVVAGTAWKGWDAWYGNAPRFDNVKIAHQIAA